VDQDCVPGEGFFPLSLDSGDEGEEEIRCFYIELEQNILD
jgi:hypothetical protein